MILISSEFTKFYKTIFPTVFLGGNTLTLLIGIIATLTGKENNTLLIILAPLFIGSIAAFIFKHYAWRLVDEVGFDGTALQVRNNKKIVRIELNQIQSIHFSGYQPPFVEIFFKERTELGDEILFTPPYGDFPCKKHPMIQHLIDRFEKTKSQPDGVSN